MTQIAYDAYGCSDTAKVAIKINNLTNEITTLTPNAISPNGDGKNDFFFASGLNVTSFGMQIYNRWGEKIFESNDISTAWNGTYKGTMMEYGIYIWTIDFSIGHKESQKKTGHVALIR